MLEGVHLSQTEGRGFCLEDDFNLSGGGIVQRVHVSTSGTGT